MDDEVGEGVVRSVEGEPCVLEQLLFRSACSTIYWGQSVFTLHSTSSTAAPVAPRSFHSGSTVVEAKEALVSVQADLVHDLRMQYVVVETFGRTKPVVAVIELEPLLVVLRLWAILPRLSPMVFIENVQTVSWILLERIERYQPVLLL